MSREKEALCGTHCGALERPCRRCRAHVDGPTRSRGWLQSSGATSTAASRCRPEDLANPFLNTLRSTVEKAADLVGGGGEILDPPEELPGGATEPLGDREYGGHAGITLAGFDSAQVVGRQVRALGKLLKREPQVGATTADLLAQRHVADVPTEPCFGTCSIK
jgi:hypothetical protein